MFGTAGATRRAEPSLLDREVDAIANAVAEGPVRVPELAQRVGARRWGPGRFRSALDTAIAEGRARRVSRTMIGPPASSA
jgi:hypothetical protein